MLSLLLEVRGVVTFKRGAQVSSGILDFFFLSDLEAFYTSVFI